MKNQNFRICLLALLGSLAHHSIGVKNAKPKGSRAIGGGLVTSDYPMFNTVDTHQFPDIHPDIMEDTLLTTVNLLSFQMKTNAVQ